CYFNFGQSPFRYPPRDVQFTDFHAAANGDARRYQLATTICLPKFEDKDEIKCFIKPPIDNQVQLLFRDETQIKCDKGIQQFEQMILHGEDLGKFFANNLTFIQHLGKWGQIRILQSIVEVLKTTDTKVDLVAYWVR